MADTERDPKLSQRYAELGREEPPRALDDAILAASRRDLDMRPAPLVPPTGRSRWYFPLAAAAVIVLAVAVTWHIEREQPQYDGVASVPPAPVAEARKEAKPMERKAPAVERRAPQPVRPEAPRPFAAEPAATQAPAPAPAAVADAIEERRDIASAAGAVAPRADMPARQLAKTESPEQALERIAELRKQGKDAEADRALAEFRKQYPDYRISEAMLEKVNKK